mmetsp:Transcript_47104/g.145274  ORF Transcript_47104/g.145274 Transcript_47104/m.145274 type:complete len:232 (-) Transcript_47104:13-708(-)
MRSPLNRHSILLSSSTVFMFSIQMASTGPSKTIHCRSGFTLDSDLTLRAMPDSKPSVHSRVIGLMSPYSSPIVIDLGFSTCVCTTLNSGVLPDGSQLSCFIAVSVRLSVLRMVVLAQKVWPTVITPWRTTIVSKSWCVLSRKPCVAWRLLAAMSFLRYSTSCALGSSVMTACGNRSLMSAMKSTVSSRRNLGTLASRIARISSTSSSWSGFARFRAPAMTRMDLTARMPKS